MDAFNDCHKTFSYEILPTIKLPNCLVTPTLVTINVKLQ